jgi:hypothetical protein
MRALLTFCKAANHRLRLAHSQGAEHVNDNIDQILNSFKARVVNNTSVIDRLSSRLRVEG